jgi:hypothetical protein
VAALAVLAASALLASCDDDARVQEGAAKPVRVIAAAPALATTPGWQDLGHVPRSVNAEFAVVAWTGHELLLWGGNRSVDCSRAVSGGSRGPTYRSPAPCDHSPREGLFDGVALDPFNHRWHSIPHPPLDVPLLYPVGVWDGRQLIITGQSCWAPTAPDMCYPGGFPVVAYDPQRNSWSKLPPLPSPHDGPDTEYARAIGWTGRLAVFSDATQLFGYDPAAQRWSEVGDSRHKVDTCASEHRIVALVAKRISRSSGVELHFEVRSDRPDSEWTASPGLGPDGALASFPDRPLHCTATGAAALNHDRVAFVFDAAHNTVTRRELPGIHGNWYPVSTRFAPLGPDHGAEIELPAGTTAAFDAGRRVFAVTGDHVETLLRR